VPNAALGPGGSVSRSRPVSYRPPSGRVRPGRADGGSSVVLAM